jgi:hypothetical protein
MRTLIAALLLTLPALAGDGQGPVKDGPIQIADLRLGTYWYGANIDLDSLKGKIVLVETWGS